MSAAGNTAAAQPRPWSPDDNPNDTYKWKAFGAIGTSFVTQVMSMSMVFVALSQIADDFGITLRAVTWVIIAQSLTISALMMPMGRLADIVGRKRVHMTGLVFFGGGAIFAALSPTFGILILARVIMAVGNSMGQSVGTAMTISVFPSNERGKAIGSQTTAVAIGGASGPIIGGLILQVMPWQALFFFVAIPIVIAFVASYFILDEERVSQRSQSDRPPFDYVGAVLSAVAIIILVLTINNPLGVGWLSPLIIGGAVAIGVFLAGFVMWELQKDSPMLELRLFKNAVFSMAVTTRLMGFMGTTAVRFMMPIFLISFRGLGEAAAGGVLFLTSLGMGIAAQASGRLSDRFGSRPFGIAGFIVLIATSLALAFTDGGTPMWYLMLILLVNGLAMGLWNVPNNSVIMGAVPRSEWGVVSALTNLTRNVGNVTGQAIASAVVVGVMAASGFDIPLSEIGDTPGAGAAFVDGWKAAYLAVTGFSAVGLLLSFATKPAFEAREHPQPAPSPQRTQPQSGDST